MRLIFTLFVISLIATTLRAQSTETISEYFDKDWITISDPKQASFYRTKEYQDDRIIVRDYFISGKIQMMAECSEATPKLVFDGKVVWYYENGVKKSECNYKENEQIGLYTSYYEDGAIKMKKFSEPGKKSKYIQYMSPAGEELLVQGNGTVLEESSTTFECYTVIEDSIALATFNVDRVSHDTTFATTERPAEFKGGLEGLARYLQTTVKYPKPARRSGAQGTVLVAFIVDRDGTVKDCHIIRKVDPNCDAAALKAVSSMDRWTPAEHKGVPVKSRFVLPVKFRLTP